MTLIVSAAEVRAYLMLNANNPTNNSQYTDATIASNVLAAQEFLETATNRWLVDRPATTFTTTTQFRPIVTLPGFRTVTAVTWGGTAMTVSGADQNIWPLPDPLNSGQYLALQFRTLVPTGPRTMYEDPMWWDKGYDVGLGRAWRYADTSQANDLTVAGDGGFAAGSEPFALRHAVKVMAAFYTKRPESILADVAITPAGGVLNYSRMPDEVAEFIGRYKGGMQVASV